MSEFDKDKYIYQSFWFKNEIKEIYFAGNIFMQHSKNMGIDESFNLAVEMIGDKDAFMPTLVKKIEWLIGKKNCHSDFWEFGDDDFSLYWFIKKDVYHEKMKLIREWIKYEELEELVWYKETENTNK